MENTDKLAWTIILCAIFMRLKHVFEMCNYGELCEISSFLLDFMQKWNSLLQQKLKNLYKR